MMTDCLLNYKFCTRKLHVLYVGYVKQFWMSKQNQKTTCTELVQLKTIYHQCHHIVGNLCTNEYIWQSIACTSRNPNGTSKTLPLHCAIYQAGCSCSTILLGQSAWDDEQAGTNIEQQSNKQLSSFSVCLPVLLVFPGSSAYKQSWSVNPTAAVAKRPL